MLGDLNTGDGELSVPTTSLLLQSCMSNHPPPSPDLSFISQQFLSARSTLLEARTLPELHQSTQNLAKILHQALEHDCIWAAEVLTDLADATRESVPLRSLFGLLRRITDESSGDILQTPDCVLDLARQITEKPAIFRPCVLPALRLIANCCADDNVNRSLVIRRNGISFLRDLALTASRSNSSSSTGLNLHVLLSTIYNVCAEFDEPATDASGSPLILDQSMLEARSDTSGTQLTLAEWKLGGYRSEIGHEPVVYSFLGLAKHVSEAQLPLLADIIELASRSFLYSNNVDELWIQHIFSPEASVNMSTRQTEFDQLLTGLVFTGGKIAKVSADAQAAICQTWLNIMTHEENLEALGRSGESILSFIDLAWLEPDDVDEDIDIASHRRAFLKVVYAISATLGYVECSSPSSPLFQALLNRLDIGSNGQGSENINLASSPRDPLYIASILVLVNNALTSIERVDKSLDERPSLSRHVLQTLLSSNSETVMLPALKLVSRLALTKNGVQSILTADPEFSTIARLLDSSTPVSGTEQSPKQPKKHTLAIQHEVAILARQLIKASPVNTSHFLKAGRLSLLLNAGVRSIDASYKLELARLIIEVLRNLASPQCSQSDGDTIADQVADPTTFPVVVSNMAFLLPNAPTPAAQTEALFGLGLLSSLFCSPSSRHHRSAAKITILSVFSEDDENSLAVFRRVASTQGSGAGRSDYENLATFLMHLLKQSNQNTDPLPTMPISSHLEQIAQDMRLQAD